MKNSWLIYSVFFFVLFLYTSCDKVDQIYKPKSYDTELNVKLYPGDWQTYIDNDWPNFDTIPINTQRNILIEDFTGHNCMFCPAAATVAHQLHIDNPNRVFVSSIHASPTGITSFQAVKTSLPDTYPIDFTNSDGLALGKFFGGMSGSGFVGNPSVGGSRIKLEDGEFYYNAGNLASEVNKALVSDLKVSIKSHLNYYPSTKGVFLHTAVNILDNQLLASNLGTVVVVQQDSLIAPQNVSGVHKEDYVHRDIHRYHVNNSTWGVTLRDEFKKDNDNDTYFFDYSFVLSNALSMDKNGVYQAENMHLLIYVYDKTSYEIYQVVRQSIVEN